MHESESASCFKHIQHQAEVPIIIDGLQVKLVIGQGGQATVYLACRPGQSEYVSIKVFNQGEEHFEAYQRQANILNQLSHANAIKILGHNPAASIIFDKECKVVRPIIILQFAYYGDLFNIICNSKVKISEKSCKYILRKVLQFLLYLRQQNICHRDIKLENVLVSKQLCLKFIDFGISTRLNYKYSSNQNPDCKDIGTEPYKAPEVYKCEYDCEKIDVFAVGVMFFCLCVGRPPFESARYSNKQYGHIRNGRYGEFWNFHREKERKNKFLGDNLFKQLVTDMLCFDPLQRPSYQKLLQNEWLNHFSATQEEFKDEILKVFQSGLHTSMLRLKDYQVIQQLLLKNKKTI